jgi:hypothetical protein
MMASIGAQLKTGFKACLVASRGLECAQINDYS